MDGGLSQPHDLGRVGLALSGGGARAIAYHLGCLRALHKAGILERLKTISAVSGGSVLAALYCTDSGDFAAFDAQVCAILRRGFVRPAIRVSLTSLEGCWALANAMLLALDRVAALAVRLCLCLIPNSKRWDWFWLRESPFRRRASRTTILARTFDAMLGGALLSDLREDRPTLIVVACDLVGRCAFYFAKESVGSWKRGKASASEIRLSEAISASAAFPGLLPAIDARMSFIKNGQMASARIVLTDGGVYDNLGLSPLWPGRDDGVSLHVEHYDRLVACRAGYASRFQPAPVFWVSRMLSALETIHDRAQNASIKRLFDLKAGGVLTDFILSYLDKTDSKLGHAPENFVKAEEVSKYPTDFSAMSDVWIDRLSRRGEQVTHALLVQQKWISCDCLECSVHWEHTVSSDP